MAAAGSRGGPKPVKQVPVRAAPTKAAPRKGVPSTKAAPAKQAPVKQAPVKKAPVKAAPVKAAPVQLAPAKRAPTKSAAKAPSKTVAPPPAPTAPAAVKAPVKAPVKALPAAPKPSGPLTGADAWTKNELKVLRKQLDEQAKELRGEIDDAESLVETLKRDASSEGSGDEADAGTKTFEREHEMSLANNSRDLLQQVERALARLDEGTYGRCETCGQPIPKARLQAAPRATLCVSCKQREERR